MKDMSLPSDDLLPMEAALARIDAWFAQHRPRFYAALQPGVVELDWLPEPLRMLLAWRNGQRADLPGCFEEYWYFMSVAEICAADMDRPGWTPFLDDDMGNYLCVDEAGAVRLYALDETDATLIAPSLAAWLRAFADHLEHGDYVVDPERGTLIRTPS